MPCGYMTGVRGTFARKLAGGQWPTQQRRLERAVGAGAAFQHLGRRPPQADGRLAAPDLQTQGHWLADALPSGDDSAGKRRQLSRLHPGAAPPSVATPSESMTANWQCP